MALVFWDAHGILFIDYLEKGKTIYSDYYMASLDQSSAEIKKKRPHTLKGKVLFYQDNASCHEPMKTMVKFNELSSKLLPHPPHSPDVAPQRLLALCWPEKNAPGKEIWLQWRSDYRNWGLFWEQRRIILQKRHRKVREAFEWMYWLEGNYVDE